MLLFRQPMMCFGLQGVTQSELATAGDHASPLADDLMELEDRSEAEWLWALTMPLPTVSITRVNSKGAYALIGPQDGINTQGYRAMVMPKVATPPSYTAFIQTTVGGEVVVPTTINVPMSMHSYFAMLLRRATS